MCAVLSQVLCARVNDISIYYKDDNSRIVVIHYSVVKGNTIEKSSVAVKI